VEPLPLIAYPVLTDEILIKLVPKVPLPIKMVLGESVCEGDHARSDNSPEYDEFDYLGMRMLRSLISS